MKPIAALSIVLAFLVFWSRAASADAGNRVVVKYWEKWTGFEKDAMQAVVDDFNRSQDRIFVDYLSISGIAQKTLIATAGGTPPDIAGLWANEVADFDREDALMPLDDLAAGSTVSADRYLPVFWDMVVYKGKLYGVPSTPVTIAFYWNKDLFRARGLDPEKPPSTIAELDEYAQKLTKIESGRITQWVSCRASPSGGRTSGPTSFTASSGTATPKSCSILPRTSRRSRGSRATPSATEWPLFKICPPPSATSRRLKIRSWAAGWR